MKRDLGLAWGARVGAAGLLISILSGCLQTSVRTDPAAAEEGRGLLPSEQGAQRATFALG